VWIEFENAVFVPPNHEHIADPMGDLENFIYNDEIYVPYLIRVEILHYQVYNQMFVSRFTNLRVNRSVVVGHNITNNERIVLATNTSQRDFFLLRLIHNFALHTVPVL